ncbi:MAG: MFS transporter [Catenulispora sp.]|nr:MFS transporter [Catenulispora sp.]
MADAERDPLPRSFWWFLTAGAVSWLGDGLIVVGFPLLAAGLHASPVGIAAVVVGERLAPMLLALPLGALADRWNTRRTAVGTNLTQAALFAGSAALVAGGHLGLAGLIAVAFAANVLGTLFTCTTGALLPDVVRPAHFQRATTWLRASNALIAFVVGPGLGGLVYATGHALPLLLDAGSFVAAAVVLAALRLPDRPARPAAARRRFLDEAMDGIRISFSAGPMRLMMVFFALMTLAQAGSVAAIVVLGRHVVGLSSTGFGWALAAGNIAAVAVMLSVGRIVKLRASTAVIAAIVAGAVGELLLGLAHSGPQISVGLAMDGSAVLVIGVLFATTRLRIVPREQLGRMTGGFQSVLYGAGAAGTMLGGVLADISGRLPYLVCAGVYLLMAVTMGRWMRGLDAVTAVSVPAQAAPEEAAAGKALPEQALPEQAAPEQALPQKALPEEPRKWIAESDDSAIHS